MEIILVEGELVHSGERPVFIFEDRPQPPLFSYAFFDPQSGHVWCQRVIAGQTWQFVPQEFPDFLLTYEVNQATLPPNAIEFISQHLLNNWSPPHEPSPTD